MIAHSRHPLPIKRYLVKARDVDQAVCCFSRKQAWDCLLDNAKFGFYTGDIVDRFTEKSVLHAITHQYQSDIPF